MTQVRPSNSFTRIVVEVQSKPNTYRMVDDVASDPSQTSELFHKDYSLGSVKTCLTVIDIIG